MAIGPPKPSHSSLSPATHPAPSKHRGGNTDRSVVAKRKNGFVCVSRADPVQSWLCPPGQCTVQIACAATPALDAPRYTSRRRTIRWWPERHHMLCGHNRRSPTGSRGGTPSPATGHASSRFRSHLGRFLVASTLQLTFGTLS